MRNSRGFTLLEIIIAISLIAIFITLPVLAYSNYLKKTRDTQRKNSVNQIQSALEQYRANNGKYPPTDTWKDVLVSQGYLPTIPKDPLDGQGVAGESGVVYKFDYSADPDGQNYQLTSRLEENQPGGKGYSNEKSTYVVTPIGPMIRYTTPMLMGSGSGSIASGTINGAFTGTGSGAVNSGIVGFTGTMSGNTFTGSFSGNVAGSGVSGMISGSYSGTATGNATGSVSGNAIITGGTANSSGNTFTGGTFSNLTLTPNSGPGVGRITDGNLTATFSGSGSGAVTGGSVTYTGSISGNIFTGSVSGTVTGSSVSGTISGGPVNVATSGSLTGNVSGTTAILSGNVSGSGFLGNADIANLQLTGNGLPSGAPIPTSTNYPTRAVTATPTKTPTPTRTPTPTNLPTSTPTPMIPYWTTGGTNASIQFGNGGVAVNGSDIYVFGGYDSINNAVKTMYKYNSTSQAWTTLAQDTIGRSNNSLAYWNGKLYSTGGGPTSGYDNLTRIYDIATNSWSAGSNYSNQYTTFLGAHTSIAYNGKIYTFSDAGTGIYTIATNTWSELAYNANQQQACDRRASAVLYGAKVYVYGGYDYTSSASVIFCNSLRIFDIATNTWSAGASDSALGRSGHSAAAYNGKMYVFGGMNKYDEFGNGTTLNSTRVYTIASNSWSASISDVNVRGDALSALVGSGMYILTGSNATRLNVTSGTFPWATEVRILNNL